MAFIKSTFMKSGWQTQEESVRKSQRPANSLIHKRQGARVGVCQTSDLGLRFEVPALAKLASQRWLGPVLKLGCQCHSGYCGATRER